MRLEANKHAMGTLAIVLIVIIVVGAVVAVAVAAALFGFWHPFGQVVGSGELVTDDKDFTDFTIVEVGWGFEVEIDQADSYSINITADDNILDHVEVFSRGNKLIIGLKWGYIYQDVTLRAKITMPDLYELKLSGGTHCTAEEFTSSHDFVVDLSGGSRIDELEGAANDLTVSGSGGSHLDLSEFSVHDATVNLSGGSQATINLDGRLDADLSGGSNLFYIGDPTMGNIQTSGGSSVEKK